MYQGVSCGSASFFSTIDELGIGALGAANVLSFDLGFSAYLAVLDLIDLLVRPQDLGQRPDCARGDFRGFLEDHEEINYRSDVAIA